MADFYSYASSIANRGYYIKKNLVAEKSWTWTYVRYRILRPILKVYNRLLKAGYGKHRPWLSPAAIKILSNMLEKTMTGLEYGSGRSTYFFAHRLKSLVSIEHHPGWHQMVEKELEKKNVSNVKYELVPVETLESKKEIEMRYKKPFDNENQNYSDYFKRAERFPDNSFDFILIDGRARVECTKRAIPKLKSGGVLILDNSERTRYKPIHEMLKDWPKVDTTTGLTDTTLWFKP